jgi:hypothetical protein
MPKQDNDSLDVLETLVRDVLAFMLIFLGYMLGLVDVLFAIDTGEL